MAFEAPNAEERGVGSSETCTLSPSSLVAGTARFGRLISDASCVFSPVSGDDSVCRCFRVQDMRLDNV